MPPFDDDHDLHELSMHQPMPLREWCAVCRDQQVDLPGDLCPRCLEDKARGYRVRTLTGRCANGAERDHGTLQHALPLSMAYRDDVEKAHCSIRPGRRSVGWSTWLPAGNVCTCPRCLKRLKKLGLKT